MNPYALLEAIYNQIEDVDIEIERSEDRFWEGYKEALQNTYREVEERINT